MADYETLCGIGYFRPKFLQKFANRSSYLFVHCLLACTQVGQDLCSSNYFQQLVTFSHYYYVKVGILKVSSFM